MNAAYSPALEQALAAHRTPGLYATLRERSIPQDILLLLRVAGRDSAALEQAAAWSGESSSQVREAVVLYIQHLMFFAGSDSYRVLGVAPDAPDATIKENYRWLVRWLHPDKNDDQWDAVYADRVTLAWQDLRTAERRRDYSDRLFAATPAVQEPSSAPLRRMVPAAKLRQDEFVLSTKTVRRLPAAILLSVTLLAAAVLGLQYYEISDAPVAAEAEVAALAPPSTGTSDSSTLTPAVPASNLPPPIERPRPAPVASTPAPLPLPPQPAPPVAVAHVPVAEIPVAEATPAPAVAKPPAPRVERVEPPRTIAPVAIAAAAPPRAVSPAKPPAPRAAPAQAAPEVLAVSAQIAPATSELINAAIAREVLLRFRSAYSSGNIKQMQSLLSREGEIPEAERAVLIGSYRELFESSDRRHMKIRNPSWMTRADTAILVASYEAWILPRGKREEKHISGDIRFDLRQEDGELRIVRLRHDAKGG